MPSSTVPGHAAPPRRSRIIEALTRAREWRRLIDTGEVKHAAALARSRLDVVPGEGLHRY